MKNHILVDFEGCCVREKDNADVEFCDQALKYLTSIGNTIGILNSFISPKEVTKKQEAEKWFAKKGIPLAKKRKDDRIIIISVNAVGCPVVYDTVLINDIQTIVYYADWYQIIRTLQI